MTRAEGRVVRQSGMSSSPTLTIQVPRASLVTSGDFLRRVVLFTVKAQGRNCLLNNTYLIVTGDQFPGEAATQLSGYDYERGSVSVEPAVFGNGGRGHLDQNMHVLNIVFTEMPAEPGQTWEWSWTAQAIDLPRGDHAP